MRTSATDIPHLLWCLTCMLLEITAEEADIRKMIFKGNLLDTHIGALQLHLQLQDNVLVDNAFGRMAGNLANYIGEIFG